MSSTASERPGKGAESQTKRVVIEFPGESHAKLLELKESSGAPTLADVVRRALKLFEFFLQQRREGWSIQLVKGDTVREVEVLL